MTITTGRSPRSAFVQTGQTYWIRISGKNGATGDFQFTLVGPAGVSGGDCNSNDVPDECDIASGSSQDCNGNGVPDECDIAGGESRTLTATASRTSARPEQ